MVYCWCKAVLRVLQRLERHRALGIRGRVLWVLQPKGMDTSGRGKALYECINKVRREKVIFKSGSITFLLGHAVCLLTDGAHAALSRTARTPSPQSSCWSRRSRRTACEGQADP